MRFVLKGFIVDKVNSPLVLMQDLDGASSGTVSAHPKPGHTGM